VRLLVDGGGFATAASAFADANQVAALHYDALTGKLSGYAGMAGDDSTSTEFAAAYDEAAAEGVAALVDLVDSFASLAQLTQASLANHRRANEASVMGGAVIYEGSTLPEDGYVSVLPSTAPSSLGGDPSALSSEANWILDHLEGFVWPNADTDRLRDAAQTWRTAAEGLDGLRSYFDTALRGLGTQRSPEIPVAVAAIGELRTTVGDVAGEYAALADSCELYAAQVDEKREQIKALIREILAMIVEGILISAAIGAITAGAGAAAGAGAVVARVAAQSPRFLAILNALRSAAATSASAVRTGRVFLIGARARLAKFATVAKTRSAARGEVGTIGPWGRWQRGWLAQHERSGSHTLATHVGRTDDEILQRLRDQPWIKRSSSFTDQSVAERAIRELLTKEQTSIADWLARGKGNLRVEGIADGVVGRSADISGNVVDVRGLRVILTKDPNMPDGYRIFTGFPQP
jgi:Bacterial CdiA-CT RNAse A domain